MNILQQKKFGLGIHRVSPDKMCGEVWTADVSPRDASLRKQQEPPVHSLCLAFISRPAANFKL